MKSIRLEVRPRSLLVDDRDFVFITEDGTEVEKPTTEGVVAHVERFVKRRLRGAAVRRCDAIPLDKRVKVTFHSLRHTAASLMVAEGVPLFDVAKILGHPTLAVTMRCAHFAPAAGRAGIEKHGKALRGAGPTEAPGQAGGSSAVGEGLASLASRRSA